MRIRRPSRIVHTQRTPSVQSVAAVHPSPPQSLPPGERACAAKSLHWPGRSVFGLRCLRARVLRCYPPLIPPSPLSSSHQQVFPRVVVRPWRHDLGPEPSGAVFEEASAAPPHHQDFGGEGGGGGGGGGGRHVRRFRSAVQTVVRFCFQCALVCPGSFGVVLAPPPLMAPSPFMVPSAFMVQ